MTNREAGLLASTVVMFLSMLGLMTAVEMRSSVYAVISCATYGGAMGFGAVLFVNGPILRPPIRKRARRAAKTGRK